MNAVGIDVSKRKSTVTIRRPGDVVLMPPCDIPHTQSAINALIEQLKNLDGETKACMEHTGRYYEPVANWLSDAGIFVSAVNPILIRDFGDDSLRAPKTDKADSKKIARYALDRWAKLKQYGSMDKTRSQLKTMNRQFGFYMDQKTAMKNNLISLLAETDGLCPYLPACGLCPLGISKCLYSALSELVQMQELLLPCREN